MGKGKGTHEVVEHDGKFVVIDMSRGTTTEDGRLAFAIQGGPFAQEKTARTVAKDLNGQAPASER